VPRSDFLKYLVDTYLRKTPIYVYKADLSGFSWSHMWKKNNLNFDTSEVQASVLTGGSWRMFWFSQRAGQALRQYIYCL